MVKTTSPGGLITYWMLSEHTNRDLLASALASQGLSDYLPDTQSPSTIMSSVLKDVFGSKFVIRPLQSSGFQVTRETRGEDNNEYEPELTVKLTQSGEPVFSIPTDKENEILALYGQRRSILSHNQIISMLVKLVRNYAGVALRPRGGIYWISPANADKWTAAANAVEQCPGHEVYLLQQEFTGDTVRAVQDAITYEVTSEANRLLDLVTEGEQGPRAMRSRQAEAHALNNKVVKYEQWLNISLTAVREAAIKAEQATFVASAQEFEE